MRTFFRAPDLVAGDRNHNRFCRYGSKKNIFYPANDYGEIGLLEEEGMGFFDDLGKALKKVEEDVKKSDLDKQLKNVEQGLNKAGKDVSTEINAATAPARPASPAPSVPVAAPASQPSTGRSIPHSPHPGYAKIAAWMKRNYKSRITASGDNFQQGLQLEQLAAEATSGLPAKARKGFMDYLKKQNYEPLLK